MAQRFLVVEDDETVRKFAVTALQADGHDVLTASSVEEARNIVASQPPSEALCLVIDVVLEHESGIHFAQEIVKQNPGYRVLLISGFTDEVLMTAPQDVQRIAFLRKPFTRPDLAAAVGTLCG